MTAAEAAALDAAVDESRHHLEEGHRILANVVGQAHRQDLFVQEIALAMIATKLQRIIPKLSEVRSFRGEV